MRKEKDALGEVLVGDDKYYGAQTQRARENFAIGEPGREGFARQLVAAHTVIKKAAGRVNGALGLLDEKRGAAIEQAADEVLAGKFDDQFPLVIWQSGSGTQFNMNVNEVIANRANEILGGKRGSRSPVHPNDHVNMSQSTNDTFSSSMHIAAALEIKDKLRPAVRALGESFAAKAAALEEVVKIGRTHLQDATPLTLGQELGGYSAQLAQADGRIEGALEGLAELGIGGTAVGTGLGAPVGFDERMVAEISRLTGFEFRVAGNKFAAMAAHDAVVHASGSLKGLSAVLMKIADDVRWLASGPRSGLGELVLPANEPGSSIMPGKINPTQCEMVCMVACQVYGNDTAISMAGALGKFELNTYKPLMASSLLQSITLLSDACRSFNERCVQGIEANRKRIDELVNSSLMLVTALSKHIGYDKAAEIALKAWREEKTLKAAAGELGYVSVEQFEKWVDVQKMTGPGGGGIRGVRHT